MEEIDLQEKSTKRAKEKNMDVSCCEDNMIIGEEEKHEAQTSRVGGASQMNCSYKDMVMGIEGDTNTAKPNRDSILDSGEEEMEEDDTEAIRVMEKKVEGYYCLLFILSKVKERRIHKPWKQGVIIKLL